MVRALHINKAQVDRGLVNRHICAESNDLPTGPQWPEVVAFCEAPCLFLCESCDIERECWGGLPNDHGDVSEPKAW